MDDIPTIEKLARSANESGYTLSNKHNGRSKTTYTCSKRRRGCSYQCFVENGIVVRQTEHNHPGKALSRWGSASLTQPAKESPDVIEQDPFFKTADVPSKASLKSNVINFKQTTKMRDISNQVESGGGLSHKNEVFSYDYNDQLQEADVAHPQHKSFLTEYATDWETLSRACSSISQMSEAAKLLFEEKNKQLFEKDKTIYKLEEKLEVKDRELIHLRSKVGGLEVQCLKIQLAEVTARLDEKDKQLAEWKTVADQLIKSNANFDQFKQHMRNMSVRVSAATSQQSSVCSQDGQEQHDQSVVNQEQESKEAYCCYCDRITSKLIIEHYQECNLQERFNEVIEKYGKGWKVRLGDFELKESDKHITLFPDFAQMFSEIKNNLYDDEIETFEVIKKLQSDLQTVFAQGGTQMDEKKNLSRTNACHCSLCGSDFEHVGAKFQHYTGCHGLKQADERVTAQYNVFAEAASDRERQLIQTTLNIEGSTLKGAIHKINLIQQHGSAGFKTEFINNADLTVLAKLHEELNSTQYFDVLVQKMIAGPVADAQGNSIYAQNSTREILVSMLGKTTSRKSIAALKKEVISKLKRDSGITLTLDERRALEASDIKKTLQKYKHYMLNIKDYLSTFKEMHSHELFEKVKKRFCDGMILPRLEQLFKTYSDFQAAFHSAGIQVQKICPGQKEGFVYVRLQDSANEFTVEFIDKLNTLIRTFRIQLDEMKEDQQVIDGCFVQQIDCTQDIKGFFLSFDVKNDIKELSNLMNMELTHDYPSFESMFTLLRKHNYGTQYKPLLLKQTRFKIYNKLLHFLESEQGKKKISMNLKGLLNCSSEFYQKLLECFNQGLSRLEFSHYFYSFQEFQSIDVKQYQFQIDNAFEQVNKLPQIRYQVQFKHFFNSFWDCARPVFIFQHDSWTVIYAKHSISAYIGQTVKITQGRFKNKDKIECIKRFGIPGKWCTVVDETKGKVYKVMKTGSKLMQIPIQSLNTVHLKSYDFPFDETVLKYCMSDKQVDAVKLVRENGEQFEFVDVVITSEKKRDKKQKLKGNEEAAGRINITGQFKRGRNMQSNWLEHFGDKFNAQDKGGIKYRCVAHGCNSEIIRKGKEYFLDGAHRHED